MRMRKRRRVFCPGPYINSFRRIDLKAGRSNQEALMADLPTLTMYIVPSTLPSGSKGNQK